MSNDTTIAINPLAVLKPEKNHAAIPLRSIYAVIALIDIYENIVLKK